MNINREVFTARAGDDEVERKRLNDLVDKWAAQEKAFDELHAPMLAKIREMIKDIPENDLFSLGLDHIGESCPPN